MNQYTNGWQTITRIKTIIKQQVNTPLLGKEVYPEDPFWNTFELSMVGEKGSLEQIFAKYDEVLKQDAGNHAIWYNYAAEIYNTAYNEDSTKRPANVDEYLDKASEKIQKSIDLKNDYPNSHYLKGIIFTAKADQSR